jgi:ABC-2 type transport system permease protein
MSEIANRRATRRRAIQPEGVNVADVAQPFLVQLPGVLEQLKLVAGLRWGLLRNSLRNKNGRWDLIGMVIAGVVSGALVIGLCVAFYVGTYFFLTKGHASWMALLFWAIFLWWQVFPVLVAGFGANFEFENLLRFPLSLAAFYLLGLGYGFADFAAVSSVCWIGSMLVAATIVRISAVPVLLVVCLLFLLLNVTLERLVGSWLEKLLAKRRARELFIGIFLLAMVSMNFLSPFLQRYRKSSEPQFLRFLPYLWWTPGSLAGNAIPAAGSYSSHTALIGLAGLCVWLIALSVLLWFRFKAQYLGEEVSESSAPEKQRKKARFREIAGVVGQKPDIPAPGWASLLFLSPQVSGVMVKEFRYLTRNSFFFITFLLPPIMVVVFSFQFTETNSPLKEHAISPEMFFPAIMAYLILMLLFPAYNSFSFEGKGIQTYFMAPIRFRDILLGKNLLLLSLISLELIVSLTLMVWRVGWPTMPSFFATIGAAVFAVTGQLTIANWSSLSFPKKMEIGKFKGQRNNGVAVWTAFGVQILVGGIAAVVLLAGRWFGNPWLPAAAFVGLTIATFGGYVASLDSLDRLAEKKKELLINTLCK